MQWLLLLVWLIFGAFIECRSFKGPTVDWRSGNTVLLQFHFLVAVCHPVQYSYLVSWLSVSTCQVELWSLISFLIRLWPQILEAIFLLKVSNLIYNRHKMMRLLSAEIKNGSKVCNSNISSLPSSSASASSSSSSSPKTQQMVHQCLYNFSNMFFSPRKTTLHHHTQQEFRKLSK